MSTHPEPSASLGRRQFVKFAFYKIHNEWRAHTHEARSGVNHEVTALLERWSRRLVLRTYTVVGTRGDADLLLWLATERLEDLQELQAELNGTPLGPLLETPYSYLAMTKRSIYVDQYATPEDEARRDIIRPGRGKYLFVYPFVKTRAWYTLPMEERQRAMDEHIRLGRKYPDIKLNTTYSFGLDDQEFVVAFEGDAPGRFLDLVMELRESEASRYTLRDTPTFTAIAVPIPAWLDSVVKDASHPPHPLPSAGESFDRLGAASNVERGRDEQPRIRGEGALSDAYERVCRFEELQDGVGQKVIVRGEDVALFRTGDRVRAISNRCSHARGPLADGTLDAGAVVCPWHGATFDLDTGAPRGDKGRGCVPVFDTRIDDGWVYVGPMKELPQKKTNQTNDGLDDTGRKLLNLLQWEFPLAARPWKELGAKLNMQEADVLTRVRALREGGVIRQIGAIFDTRKLGYTSALIAVRTEPAKLDAVAKAINRHPGVSHNYQRQHEFNLWFTLAVPPGADLETEAKRITDLPGVERVRLLPTIKLFKIGVKLDMERDEKNLDRDEAPAAKPTKPARPLTLQDKALIRVTQEDLPLVEEPFAQLAEQAGVPQEQLFTWLDEMQAMGHLRRFAGILRHQKAGFTDNGMLTWCVPAEQIEEAGRVAGAFPQVSHCYQRPTYPDWPYNLFTMVHARSRENCERIKDQIAEALKPLGVSQSAVLYTLKEYKKERVKYFAEAAP